MKNISVYENTDGGFELSKDNVFKKVVAKIGKYISSSGKSVTLTKELFSELVETFKKEVPIPRGHKGFYDPALNTGWVKGLAIEGDNLVADMEFTDSDIAQKVKDKTIKDVSIGVIKENGKKILEHIAITLNPAISDLGDFVAVAPEGVKLEKFEFEDCIKKEDTMADIEETKEPVSDTVELETAKKEKEEFESAKNKIIELEKLLADKDSIMKQAEENLKLELEAKTKTVAEYKEKSVEMELEGFIKAGNLLPANKDIAKKLLMFEGKIELEGSGSVDVAEAVKTFIKNSKSVSMEVHTAPKNAIELEKTGAQITAKEYEMKSDKERKALLEKAQKGEIKIEGIKFK